jgi:hypothetical protein
LPTSLRKQALAPILPRIRIHKKTQIPDFRSQENLKKNLKLFLFKSFINVNDQDLICGEQSIADILFEKQTNQEPDD